MNWAERIDRINSGYKDSAVLLSACKCGLFDALGGDWKTAAEVAADRGLDERAVGVVLCYPQGHEYITAHAAYRQLARRLSEVPESLFRESLQRLRAVGGRRAA